MLGLGATHANRSRCVKAGRPPRSSCSASPRSPALEPGTSGGLPSFIMVSPDKTGSTAIYADLTHHPRVDDRVACKELRFWNAPAGEDTSCHTRPQLSWEKLLDLYRVGFPPPCDGLISGEATPRYFMSAVAAGAIAQSLPRVRLLFFSRDPVMRFLSRLLGNRASLPKYHGVSISQRTANLTTCAGMLLDSRQRLEQCAGGARAIARAKLTRGGCCIGGERGLDENAPLSRGLYADGLRALWLPHFELGRQLLVMPSELFLPTNASAAQLAYQRVFAHLGLEPWTPADFATRPSAHEHRGSNHTASYAAYLERLGRVPSWGCQSTHLRWLKEFYAPANAALSDMFWQSEAALLRAQPALRPIAWQLPAYMRPL